MSDMKCPLCKQELRKIHPTYVICDNCRITGDNELWQELIRTRKALDVAVDALKEIKDGKIPVSLGICMDINDALEQITALEQKE